MTSVPLQHYNTAPQQPLTQQHNCISSAYHLHQHISTSAHQHIVKHINNTTHIICTPHINLSSLHSSHMTSLVQFPPKSFFLEFIKNNHETIECDLCSIPKLLFRYIDVESLKSMSEACYIHDFLYRKDAPEEFEYQGQKFKRTKEFADKVFRQHLIESGVSNTLVTNGYLAVKYFGGSSFNIQTINSNKGLTFELLEKEYMKKKEESDQQSIWGSLWTSVSEHCIIQ